MKHGLIAATCVAVLSSAGSAYAGTSDAQSWINSEFQPSTLSKSEQMS